MRSYTAVVERDAEIGLLVGYVPGSGGAPRSGVRRNADGSRRWWALESAGLRLYFSVIVGSGAVGYAKPHAEIFRTAATQLGLEPFRILYGGDDIEHDFIGAGRVGF